MAICTHANKADWVLFPGRQENRAHFLHIGFLPARLVDKPTLYEKRNGFDRVERDYHELMDCYDANGLTFDEAIKINVLPDKSGSVNNTCECIHCYIAHA